MEEILGATLTSTSTSTTSFMVDNGIRTDGRITWTSTTTSSTTPTTPADREAEGSVNEEALLVEDDEYEEDLEAWETSFPNATAGVEDTSGGQPWDEDQWVELPEEEWPVDDDTAPLDDATPPGGGVGDIWEDDVPALEGPRLTPSQQAFAQQVAGLVVTQVWSLLQTAGVIPRLGVNGGQMRRLPGARSKDRVRGVCVRLPLLTEGRPLLSGRCKTAGTTLSRRRLPEVAQFLLNNDGWICYSWATSIGEVFPWAEQTSHRTRMREHLMMQSRWVTLLMKPGRLTMEHHNVKMA